MRILQLTLRIPHPPNDGGAIAMFHLARHWRLAGHYVALAALNTNKHHADPASVFEAADEVWATEINTDISLTGALKSLLFSRLPYNIARFLSLRHAQKLIEVIETRGPFDVIQLEGSYTGLYVDVLKATTPTPIVLRAHNVEYEIWERMAKTEPNVARRAYYRHLASGGKRFEAQLVQRVEGLVAITTRDEARFREMGYTGPSCTIPVGVQMPDEAIIANQTGAGPQPAIGFLGSLEWLPNLQGLNWFLTKVWPQVLAGRPDAQFAIAGKNPPAEILAWRYPNVKIVGQVPDAQAFLTQFPIIVVPVLAAGGMRVKLVESMALGRAVVSTTIGAEGISVSDGKELIIADTPELFAKALLQLMADAHLRRKLATAAYGFAQANYSWAPLANQFIEFFQHLR